MDWTRCEKLGNGSFATVHLAVNNTQNPPFPPLMAVKSCASLFSSSLQKEKSILEDLQDCPQVIQCFGDENSLEKGEKLYNVFLEYAPGGTLSEKLKDSIRLPEFEVKKYAKSLLKGLKYIHEKGYVHCDIKLQNILIGNDGELKIADFGLAKRIGTKETNSGCGFRGTPLYMSPENVLNGVIEPPADIWAVGCAVSEMITGLPAWRYTDLAELLMSIGVGDELPEIPNVLSEEGKDFLNKCFVKDASKRWTAEMLLDHPFVCGINDFIASNEWCESSVSPSPRCPFDFPDWVSSPECSEKSSCWSVSPEERLRGMIGSEQSYCPDWSVSEEWVTVR